MSGWRLDPTIANGSASRICVDASVTARRMRHATSALTTTTPARPRAPRNRRRTRTSQMPRRVRGADRARLGSNPEAWAHCQAIAVGLRDEHGATRGCSMTLDALIAKLVKIESLHAGATTDGER